MQQRAREIASTLIGVLRFRFDRSLITGIGQLAEFNSTRAAYVAQTSLFGYLKTRMGREYVKIFKDDEFLPSIERAKWEVFAACLADLTIYSVSLAIRQQEIGPDRIAGLARHCHRTSVNGNFKGLMAESIRDHTLETFSRRCEVTIWANAAIGAGAFTQSPEALADSSPVSDEFRELDREIVTNSIRLRWTDVRAQLRKRLEGPSVCAEWLAQ